MKNLTRKTAKLIYISTLCLAASCGDESKKAPTSTSSGPAGRQFSNELKYYDGRPSLSSDGLRIIFESGRSGTSTRIFKVNIPADPSTADAAPDAPSRLTGSDNLISETSPVLSQDGNHVVFKGTDSDGNRGAWTANWADGISTILSSAGEQVFSLDISPDASLVAYSATTAAGAVVVEVVDRAAPQTRARLTTGTRTITSLRWLQTGVGYRLATASIGESPGISTYKIETWTFSAISGVTAATPTALTTKAIQSAGDNLSAWMTQETSRILTVKNLEPSASRSVTETGPGALPDRSIFARSELLFLDPTTGAESVADTPQGDAVTGVSSSQTLTLVTVNETTRCQSGGLYGRATVMKISATPQTAASFERIVVRKTSPGKTYDLVANQCDESLTGEGVALDLTAGQPTINGAAATGTLTVAYVSIATGDPEVLVIRRAQGSTKVWDISANSL